MKYKYPKLFIIKPIIEHHEENTSYQQLFEKANKMQ